ncbi:MAG: TIGR02253 family HAD-type hydrolase [Candidatus Woesearchaeota archaeon]
MKAILFDLDNTLIDFLTMKRRCTQAAVSAMIKAGLKMDYKKAYSVMFEMYKEHGIEDQTIFQKFLRKMGKVDYKILSAGIIAYRKVKVNELVPYAGVKEVLNSLQKKGLKLGVVSDAPRLQAWLRLTEVGLVDYFDVVLGYEDTGEMKPSPLPFRKALKKMKLKPEEVVFVGDNLRRDIAGARKVGMKTVLAKYGQIKKGKGKADWEIESVNKLLNLIENINKQKLLPT